MWPLTPSVEWDSYGTRLYLFALALYNAPSVCLGSIVLRNGNVVACIILLHASFTANFPILVVDLLALVGVLRLNSLLFRVGIDSVLLSPLWRNSKIGSAPNWHHIKLGKLDTKLFHSTVNRL